MDDAEAVHKELFDTFCKKHYLYTSEKVTSKTISLVKSEKIWQAIRGVELENHSSSFKHWVVFVDFADKKSLWSFNFPSDLQLIQLPIHFHHAKEIQRSQAGLTSASNVIFFVVIFFFPI